MKRLPLSILVGLIIVGTLTYFRWDAWILVPRDILFIFLFGLWILFSFAAFKFMTELRQGMDYIENQDEDSH